MRSMITVLIVDDQKLVRISMRHILQNIPMIKEIYDVGSGEEAVQLVQTHHIDIAFVDMKMSKMDGIQTSEKLLEILPELKILMVTGCVDELLLPQAFKAGVAGYFTKGSNTTEIESAIKSIQAGQRYISSSIIRQVESTSNTPETELSLFDTLSERELQVVLMLINGKSIQKISDCLQVNDKTINSYRSRSFQKLNIANDVELTLLAARRGLLKNESNETLDARQH